MDIEIGSLGMGRSKMLSSVEAEKGAIRLLKRIEEGTLTMEVLPNNYVQFTGELEEKDYISYCSFLNSANGKLVIQMLEEADAGEFIKL